MGGGGKENALKICADVHEGINSGKEGGLCGHREGIGFNQKDVVHHKVCNILVEGFGLFSHLFQ